MIDFSKKFDNIQGPDGGLTADEFNNFITELENIVKQQGIALSADPAVVTQIAQAIFLAGMKSQTFIESGSGNSYMITPVMGVNGPQLPDSYILLHGVRVAFTASHTNTGAATLNIGQSVATPLGAKPLKRLSGEDVAPGEILAGASYTATYNGSLAVWLVQVTDAIQNKRLDDLEAKPTLSFTPVEQGGGVSQGNNKIHIGYKPGTGSTAIQVDATDLGDIWDDHNGREKVRAAIVGFGAGEVGTYGLFLVGGGGGPLGAGTVVAGGALGWSNADGQNWGAPAGTWVLHGAVENGDGHAPDSTTICKRIA